MKWNSHLRIAEWVGSELNFSKQEIVKLAEGSIAPDKWRDHRYHHNPDYLDKRIGERILRARRLFLTHKAEYFFEIGVCLHYIADRLIPETTYLEHLNIEEEIEEITKSRQEHKYRGYSKNYKYLLAEMRKAIENLEIGEIEKMLLLDPGKTRGKRNTISSATTNLPLHIEYKLILDIAYRISIGVTLAIISKGFPPLLLQEKVKFANTCISKAESKFKYYSFFIIGLPLLFLLYGIIVGVGVYFLVLLLNLPTLVLIIRKGNKVKNYILLREGAKMLFVFWVICSLVFWGISIFYGPKFLPAAIILLLMALLYLVYPRIPIDKEVMDEIDWYEEVQPRGE
ncbi:MAG: hypothetical protein HY769_09490 [Candidatus Stahlbacteria bacterium]|nr:hypothetical protein [Candidatus Stahlbacteria bacterium]